jgi:hypothetical protein
VPRLGKTEKTFFASLAPWREKIFSGELSEHENLRVGISTRSDISTHYLRARSNIENCLPILNRFFYFIYHLLQRSRSIDTSMSQALSRVGLTLARLERN